MKIYIVDDTSFIRLICRYHLEKAGYEVIGESHDGEEALVGIRKNQPDCVLMDMALPNMNGAEVMKAIQKDYSHIHFIVMSAIDEDFLLKNEPDLHYFSYLGKPFEGEDLLSQVKNVGTKIKGANHG